MLAKALGNDNLFSRSEVLYYLMFSPDIPCGVVVAEGVWWSEFAPGKSTVNALVSQRLTDRGGGSTIYDNRVDVR